LYQDGFRNEHPKKNITNGKILKGKLGGDQQADYAILLGFIMSLLSPLNMDIALAHSTDSYFSLVIKK
jgi:hypothetical protein